MKHTAFIFFILLLLTATAQARPGWIDNSALEDTTYKYYIGRSEPSASEAEAFQSAHLNAYSEAIQNNFGFEAKVQLQAYENDQDAAVHKRQLLHSQRVQLKGFEPVQRYKEQDDGKTTVWIRYRYSKQEIAKERLRLENLAASSLAPSPELPMSESGGDEFSTYPTHVIIETIPAGAEVFLDNERWGQSPLRIKGQIAPGKYHLELRHPTHHNMSGEFEVNLGTHSSIYQRLEPAECALRVSSEPAGAQVQLNGAAVGVTPLTIQKKFCEQKLAVRINHKEQIYLTQVTPKKDHELHVYNEFVRPQPERKPAMAYTSKQEVEEDSLHSYYFYGSKLQATTVDLPIETNQVCAAFRLGLNRSWAWDLGLVFGYGEQKQAANTPELSTLVVETAVVFRQKLFLGLSVEAAAGGKYITFTYDNKQGGYEDELTFEQGGTYAQGAVTFKPPGQDRWYVSGFYRSTRHDTALDSTTAGYNWRLEGRHANEAGLILGFPL